MTERKEAWPSAYIKSLRVRGFKSFGEDEQKFTFTKGINLIVGANGSGKSNILDAICFALCAKTSSLRVRYNAELQSTETKEPCEVTLEILMRGTDAEEKVTTLSAAVNSDDSRVYRVNGKLKAFKDVKEILQVARLYIEGSGAAVHQSQVTELADNNSPKLIASIISDASGAGRWNEEVIKAQHEINKTRKDLDDIEENIRLLERLIEKDQASMKVLGRIKQLEADICILASQLHVYLHDELTSLKMIIDEKVGVMKEKESILNEKLQLLENRKEKLKGLKQFLKIPTEELENERNQIIMTIAEKEEKQSTTEKKIHAAKDAVMELKHLDDIIKSIDENVSLINFEIEKKHHLIGSLKKQLSHNTSSGEPRKFYTELKHSILVAEEKLHEFTTNEHVLVESLELLSAGRDLKQGQLGEYRQRLDAVYNNLKLIKMHNLKCRMEVLSQQISGLEEEREALVNKSQSIQAKLGMLTAEEASLPAWPLHSCFSFKKGFKDNSPLFLALNIMSGPLRKTCVTETTESAAKLLQIWHKNGNTTRFRCIWPLDRLKIEDRYKQQKYAQQYYPEGSVLLPIEQFDFDAKFEKAIKRVFQSYVISSNDEIAKNLIIHHRLWSVTIDGKVSQLGSVSGGWHGMTNCHYIQTKFEHDQLSILLNSIPMNITSAKEEMKELEMSISMFERLSHEAEDMICKTKSIEQQIGELDIDIKRQKIALEENYSIASYLRNEIATNKRQLETVERMDDVDESSNLLNQMFKAAKDDEVKLQTMLDDTIHRQEKMRTERNILENKTVNIDVLVGMFNSYANEIQLLRDRLQTIECKIENSTRSEQSNDLHYANESRAINQDTDLISKMEEDIKTLKECIITLQSDMKRKEDELESIPQFEVDIMSLCKENIVNEIDYHNRKVELNYMMEELKKLKRKESQISFEQLSSHDETKRLEIFKERWISISESIDILMEGIEKTREKVHAANETTYRKVRQSFIDCCKLFLPTKRLDLIKTGDVVEDGIRFALLSNKEGQKGAYEEWKCNLHELSGGQRTIISLAFILMVAKCSHSSVYLMDEVDAALDEQNQQSLASLIRCVIGESNQVICVSHNITFQQNCDRVIQVTRVDGQTKHLQSYNVHGQQLSKKTKM